MAGPPFNPPTDPADCFALSPFGFGPFPEPGEQVLVCPPHPDFSGFGGVGWVDNDLNLESVRGAPYGLSTYGRPIASQTLMVAGGYGGDPYGLGPYGSVEKTPPRLTSAVSLTPWTIQVFFSEEMDPTNPALLSASSYVLTAVVGAAPSTVLSVVVGSEGTLSVPGNDYLKGVLSVILTHTGTTLGGTYKVKASGPTDISGNAVLDVQVSLFTRGEPPAYTVTATSGKDLTLTFAQDMLPNASIVDLASYDFTSNPSYPITLRGVLATLNNLRELHLETVGMTSLAYTCAVSPAVAISYNGTYLPSAATSFTGVAVNAGNGTSTIVSGNLSLTRLMNLTYGWSFQDTSGKVTPGTTFRTDVHFDASQAVYNPPLASFASITVARITIEDSLAGGGVQVLLTLQRGVGAVDQIRIQSGVYDKTVSATWSTGPTKVSLVRNILAGTYTLLVNDAPVDTTLLANFTHLADTAPMVSFVLLNSAVDIAGFRIDSLKFTASNTVYSAAWNFLHDWQAVFQGSNALTRDFILTERGPLVKDWGDMTPATKQDVAVRVNNVAVTVKEVNPYIGKITLDVPVPLLPPGDPELDVKVDYQWLATPVMEMAGLNTDGLVLNKWDRNITGFHDNGAVDWSGWDTRNLTSIPYDKRGAPDISRFPMGVVLGPMVTPQPLWIGHRYMGFVKAASALLNSPTTLLLNQDPLKAQVPGFVQIPEGAVAAFEGTTGPLLATPPWVLVGTDAGDVNVSAGTYVVKDTQAGSFQDPTPPCSMYQQEVDLSAASAITVVTRYLVDSTTPDGVFTGVGFGVHDDKRLYLVGNLLVNQVQHVGMLINARSPHLLASWQIGPKVQATVLSSTTATFPTSSLPTSLKVGGRFQILSPHPQAGVYTVGALVHQTTGKSTVTVSPAFPAEPNKYGNKYPDALFETLWESKPSTYRLTLIPDKTVVGQKVVQLSMSGLTSVPLVTEFTGAAAELPLPAETSLALFTNQDVSKNQKAGQMFWGSLSYKATSQSSWSFLRYGVAPDETSVRGQAKNVLTDMSVLPENETDQAWFPQEAFGYSKVSGGVLYLKATSAHETLNTIFGYVRNEPFFSKDSNLDLSTTFRLDSGTSAYGDAEIVLNDTVREVRLATLLYYEDQAQDPYRQLVHMPSASLAGLISPTDQGWTKVADPDAGTATTHENDLVFDQITGVPIRYLQTLTMAALTPPDSGDRVFEARFAVDADYVADSGTGATGIFLSADAGTAGTYGIGILLAKNGTTPKVRLVKASSQVVVQDVTFDWTDGAYHTYRVVVSGASVTLFLDEANQPVQALADFVNQGSGTHRCMFGVQAAGGQGQVLVRSVSYAVVPHSDVKRTLGVWLGGDKEDINNWELPRTDASTAKNSEEVGPAIEEMDWRSNMQVRVFRTSNWGVTVFRPDLPPPPYYQAETAGVPGSGYTLPNLEPSAGWINVEYSQLPYVPRKMGLVGFGSFNSESITQQRWDTLSFKLSKTVTDDWKAPQHMVLNQYEVMTSGEPVIDVTLETVVTDPLPGTDGYRRLSLLPSHLYASDVYKVIDGNTVYTSESWTFDSASQLLTLNPRPDGTLVVFSGQPLTVMFYPGDKITETYLKSQPLLDSMTLLNEGTPPVPKSQDMDDQAVVSGGVRSIVAGTETLTQVASDGTESNVTSPEALYESMKFMTVDNGGWLSLITIAGEGFLPGGFTGFTTAEGDLIYDDAGQPTGSKVGQAVGAHVLGFKGTKYSEQPQTPKKDAFEQGGGMPGKFFMASGGNFLGPVVDNTGKIVGQKPLGGRLGPNTVLLYPNAPSKNAKAGTDSGATNRRTQWYLRMREALTSSRDEVYIGTMLNETLQTPSDDTPPSFPAGYESNPNGTPSANGAALMVLEEGGNYSHVGPWGGPEALAATAAGSAVTQKSLLGGGAALPPTGAMTLGGGAQLPQGTVQIQTLTNP